MAPILNKARASRKPRNINPDNIKKMTSLYLLYSFTNNCLDAMNDVYTNQL